MFMILWQYLHLNNEENRPWCKTKMLTIIGSLLCQQCLTHTEQTADATHNWFFTFHFLLQFIIAAIVIDLLSLNELLKSADDRVLSSICTGCKRVLASHNKQQTVLVGMFYLYKLLVRINLPLFSTVFPSNICMFLSCRSFVVMTTLSTGLVGVEVTSVSWLGQLKVGTGQKHTYI